MEKNELFICECHNVEHQIVMSYFEDEKEVYCNIYLNPERNVIKRIIHAIKYIFGHRSVYGDFDEFIFNPKDADKLQDVVNHLKQGKPER